MGKSLEQEVGEEQIGGVLSELDMIIKKTRLLYPIFLAWATSTFTGCVPALTYAQPQTEYVRGESWEQVKSTFKSIQDIVDYLGTIKAVREPSGKRNHTQPPEETFRKKTGDCEDYTWAALEGLEQLGYTIDKDAWMFTAETEDNKGNSVDAHTVAAFIDGGKYYFIQGYDYKIKAGIHGPFNSFFGMAKYIADKIPGKFNGKYFKDTPEEFIEAYDNR